MKTQFLESFGELNEVFYFGAFSKLIKEEQNPHGVMPS